MENLDTATTVGIVTVLVTTIGGIIVALIAKIRKPEESVALSAGAIETLTQSIKTMTQTVNDVQEGRKADREEFQRELEELREYYERKIQRLEQAHRDRVNSLKERIKALESVNGINR